MKYLGETNLFTSHFIIGDAELDRTFTKFESIEIEVLYKWLDYRYSDMGFDEYWTEDEYYSYKRRCIYFLEIVELEQFKKVTEELYHTYSKEFPYSKKKDFVTFVFDNTISFLKRFLKLNLDWIGEIEIPNEGEYIFYMDKDDIHTEFSDFVIKSKYDIEHYRQYYKAVLKYLKSFKAEKIIEPQEINIENNTTTIKTKKKPVLSEIITHTRCKEIVEGIRDQYKNIKGKQLKLLLLALQQSDLLPTEGIALKFHQCCEAEFDWDTGTYTGMNDHKYDKETDIKFKKGTRTKEIEKMKKFINSLIK